MAVPSDILAVTKNLCRIALTDATEDARLEQLYDRVIDQLAREYDFFAVTEQIPGVLNQSIYTTRANTARVLAVFWEGKQLRHATSRALDLIDPDWQERSATQAGSGVPCYYILEKIPPDLDGTTVSVGPRSFAVTPPPTAAGSFTLYEIEIPSGDAPLFLRPLIMYRLAAEYYTGATEERDKIAGDFFGQIAEMWLALTQKVLP